MKTKHKIFFAIPFDSATKALYDRVAVAIGHTFPSVTAVIGSKSVGPPPRYSNIAAFKAQNCDLVSQFVRQIQDSDVVVADLTHNNPNVHVELGIALIENKNILRVTGRSVAELGFDVRNLEVFPYTGEAQLTTTIIKYLETFFAIKALSLSRTHGPLFRRLSAPLDLGNTAGLHAQPLTLRPYRLRDGAIEVSFTLNEALTMLDWFGVYFRGSENPLLGSHLVYCRKNGAVEVAVYPGPRVTNIFRLGHRLTGRQTMRLEFENDELQINIDGRQFFSDELSHQAIGTIVFATWQARARVHSARVICRDTIDPA